MQEIDNYIPFGPEWAKEVSKLPKAKIIELWGKKGVECLKLKDELVQYKPAPDVPEITVEEFYTNTFNMAFLTPEEIQTIYTATELYARGKVRAALSRYAGEGGWIRVEDGLPNDNGFYICWCGNEPGLIHYHVDTGWQNGFYNDVVTHWMRIQPPLATTTG